MLNVPISVARMVIQNGIHPVAAWRNFYGISVEALAQHMQCPVFEIKQIETSNKHLEANTLKKLASVFGVYPEALNVRYHHYKNYERGFIDAATKTN